MKIFRGAKGEIQEINPAEQKGQEEPKEAISTTIDEAPTTLHEPTKDTKQNGTILIRSTGHKKTDKNNMPTNTTNAMDDPVVGWIVVIEGPGQGSAVKLGYGQNSIGRASTERVSLDFGSHSDPRISRLRHAIITYDPKGKKYYIQAGDSVNLTYLNELPILTATELLGGEQLVLGDTTLRFVPFCGKDFDWQCER